MDGKVISPRCEVSMEVTIGRVIGVDGEVDCIRMEWRPSKDVEEAEQWRPEDSGALNFGGAQRSNTNSARIVTRLEGP